MKMSFISTFSFFLVFKRDFIRRASNTASDAGTNKVTHRIFNTDLLHYYAHFVVEIDENLAIIVGF